VSSWKDLLKIYGLLLGAFIIVFPVELTIVLMIADPFYGVVGICLGILPFILGSYILYYLLKKKVTPSPYYYYYSAYNNNPYQSYPGYGSYGAPQPYYTYPQGAYGYPSGYSYPQQQYPYQQPQYQYQQPQYQYQQPQYQYQQPQPQPQTTGHQILPTDKDGQEEKLDLPPVHWLLVILLMAIGIGFFALYAGLVILWIPCFVIAFSFPSLIWISYVYSRDIYEPEPGRVVMIALTWGLLSTIPSLIFEAPFIYAPAWMSATLVAPFVEEAFKPMILPFLRIKIDNELDGIIYGVTAGMGFAMMENLFYEMSSINAASWSITALARGLGSTIIHAVGAGVIGYAYARYIMKKGSAFEIAGAYLFAVALHMTWNGTLTALELNASDAAFMSQILFMVIWPIVEFLILKIFLDKASHVDEQMFGPMGAKPYGKPPVPSGAAAPPALARGPYSYGAYGAGPPPPQQQLRPPPSMPPQKVDEYQAGRYGSRPDAPAAPPVPPRAQAAYAPPSRPPAAQPAPRVPTYSPPPPPPPVPYASSPPRAPTVMPDREEVIHDDDD
jgi:protease PrsW